MADRLAEIEARLEGAGIRIQMDPRIAHDLRDLLAVAKAARDVLQAHDTADGEMNWTGPAVDMLLRAAIAKLEGGA